MELPIIISNIYHTEISFLMITNYNSTQINLTPEVIMSDITDAPKVSHHCWLVLVLLVTYTAADMVDVPWSPNSVDWCWDC